MRLIDDKGESLFDTKASRSGMAAAAPPTEKATARQDQTGKASTSDGAGDTACDLNSEAATRRSKELAYISRLGLPDFRRARPRYLRV
jgi:hypothetical protein